VLANPDVACAIIGLAQADHLEEALAGAAQGPLPADGQAVLEALYARNFEA
jgi:hypothetical protein